MKKMAELIKTILEGDEKARNSDYYLWVQVCKLKCPECLNEPFLYVVANHNELGIPNFESVGRARRKVQELYPELKSNERVQKEKDKLEQEYRDFALEKNL